MEEQNNFNLYLLKFGIKNSEEQGIALITTYSRDKAIQLLSAEGVYKFQNRYEIYDTTCILESISNTEILINESIFPFEA